MPATPVALYPLPFSKMRTGGASMNAIFGPVQGGFIVNPATAEDQGLPIVENIYVDLVGPAALVRTETTFPVPPGEKFTIPPGSTTNVSVNAESTGHLFAGVLWQEPTPYPPVPPPGPFPPPGPTTLTKVMPSYLYEQYADDDDLQAMVAAYNAVGQEYVDWFVDINLPIYTSPTITGGLLDWVAQGLYGISRPTLSSGKNRFVGPLNTYGYNQTPLNTQVEIGPTDYAATSDDIFKRIITWHFYKGDGKVFDVQWLKRRIMRFLIGVNGTAPPIADTSQIGVSFGVDNQVDIRLVSGNRTLTGGAFANGFGYNQPVPLNSITSTFASVAPLQNAAIFKEAVDSGVLELPFQFTYNVTIG